MCATSATSPATSCTSTPRRWRASPREGDGGRTAGTGATDNGPGYRSEAFAEALASVGASHILTRPYSPWQNGKVERMNQTLAREWAYVRPYATNAERSEALPAFLDHYNYDRPHSACGGLPPMSRVNNVLARNS